jgi:hypothetical protein
VSSTDVRDQLAAERSIAGMVPPAVAAHIAKHGLYGGGHAAAGLPHPVETIGTGSRSPRT